MISQLQSPSVCVVDDEKEDFEPLLKALQILRVNYVHFKGKTLASLPRRHLGGLRLVFMDLHLSGLIGKAAASHAANVFKRVVPDSTAPLIVIIWSKYRNDVPAGSGDATEAELFKAALLESEPNFIERLVFLEMAKPRFTNRPKAAEWISKLKRDIKSTVERVPAFGALWAWESSVRRAADNVATELPNIAMLPEATPEPAAIAENSKLSERLKLAMRILVHEQGGGKCTAKSAPGHLATVLGQALVDQLECFDDRRELAGHGQWLADHSGLPKKITAMGPSVNAFLMTSSCSEEAFAPGNVYHLSNPTKFAALFGITSDEFLRGCFEGGDPAFEAWKSANPSLPIVVEVSPACDVHQNNRKNAMLIGGLIFPIKANENKKLKRGESIELLPAFSLRWAMDDFAKQSVLVVLSSRLKATVPASKQPKWLKPWFRFRELPTASLRNWHSAQSARGICIGALNLN